MIQSVQSRKQKPLYVVQTERDLILRNGYKGVGRARGKKKECYPELRKLLPPCLGWSPPAAFAASGYWVAVQELHLHRTGTLWPVLNLLLRPLYHWNQS